MLSYSYATKVNIRQSAATAAGVTVWSMRNATGSTKTVTIININLIINFDGTTPLAPATLRYDIRRFDTATPTSGTAQTPDPMLGTNPSSQVTDVRSVDTGLTVTSVVFKNIFSTIGVAAQKGTGSYYIRDDVPIQLSPGEGLAIQLSNDAIIGLSLTGEVVWSER